MERRDVQENNFNLEGVFVRLEHAIDSIGAKRVVLDSIESPFAGITDSGILRIDAHSGHVGGVFRRDAGAVFGRMPAAAV